jgi:hypothetical protein
MEIVAQEKGCKELQTRRAKRCRESSICKALSAVE